MKLFVLIVTMLTCILVGTGCDGAIESFKTSIGGMEVTERTTEHLLCGVARFGDNVSVSCIARSD